MYKRQGEYRTIQDYPIRGRATYLHVRKRKWLEKSSNEIVSYDWDLSEFDGRRLNSEFVDVYKRQVRRILSHGSLMWLFWWIIPDLI